MVSIHGHRCLIVVLFTMLLTGAVQYNNSVAYAKTTVVTIGTGGVTDMYYLTGGAISHTIHAKRKLHKVRALVEPTEGSAYNVNTVMAGHHAFGVVRSDHQYQAWKGLAEWDEQGRQKTLRSVFSIYSESMTLVVTEKSGVTQLSELKGKRVNIGSPESAQRRHAIDILQAVGLDHQKDIQAEAFEATDTLRLLQNGRLDACFYTVRHPSRTIREVTSGAFKVRLIPIAGPRIQAWLKTAPYYASSQIPMNYYPEAIHREDVPTVGMKVTFVTSIKVPVLVVYAIVKDVFDNLDQFKKLHPAYALLTKKSMLEGLTAPLHPGALKYYLETGLKP
ncbi:MAG: C4-dicarboxylate ABC transporter substrate-binding protein [Candidatus Entotheonella gemina]|uniref:C4-dicarboxylate ABC transporter substrate-binding protein n=1 Tax=Candidatus Entotheonella gemina TaxID=1429439 RepID=W4LBM5_9BACT|nr:MAG: C4-dicarboxylate ABC transporter substrate-binding protein [Candidatus Entotheonella gemina]